MFGKRQAQRLKGVQPPRANELSPHEVPIQSRTAEPIKIVSERIVEPSVETEEASTPSEDSEDLDPGQIVARPEEARWWIPVQVGEYRIRGLYDTGASRTVMGKVGLQLASACKREFHPASGVGARGPANAPLYVTGHVTLPFELAGVKREVLVAVIPSLEVDCYLGANFARVFGTVHDPEENTLYVKVAQRSVRLEVATVTINEVQQLAPLKLSTRQEMDQPPKGDLISRQSWFDLVYESTRLASIGLADITRQEQAEMKKLLDEILPGGDTVLGCTTWAEHVIDVGNTRPIRQKQYPVSKKIQEEMHTQTKEMLEAGVIEPSSSGWSSPVVMVRKSNGMYRFCIDFRKVNEVSKPDAYPLPNMDQILRKLQSARYISTLDLSSAYHQIPLEAESKPITAFTVPGMGLFQFKRMPFGLSNAGASFQRLIDRVIGPELEPNVFSYLDDIIIVTDTFPEHLEWIRKVLKRVKEAGLTINRDKSVFGHTEVRYLGVLVNREGFRPDPEKIEPVMRYPEPRNLKQLRRFLGMASWYRKFLRNYATIAEPLTSLTRKDRKYEWQEKQQEAFDQIKSMIATAPVLHRPVFDVQFIVQTDASDTGIGAVLLQEIDGQEGVLEFASRALSQAERNYSVTERECLAVVWAVEKFRAYIEGYHFRVVTDHSSLRWIRTMPSPTGRLARWALKLQGYDFVVEHRKGALNYVPDALSRMEESSGPVYSAVTWAESTQDQWYLDWLRKVQESPNDYPKWKIVGGQLYCYRPNETINVVMGDTDAWKIAVPKEMRGEVLKECHDKATAGHPGREKTYAGVTRYYYWPNSYKTVEEYVKNCFICQQCKVEQRLPTGLMGQRIVDRPWQMVAGDIMGPLVRSKASFEYVLVFQDLFTRWVECITLRKANGAAILKAFQERIVFRFGAPLFPQ